MHTWFGSSNNFYCDLLIGSKNCFGCCSLKHKQYCILNKQYSKEEYEELIVKIIEHMKETGEWGEFFPATMSPQAYNETLGQEYYPLSKEEVISRGWKWKEEVEEIQNIEGETQDAEKLPQTIAETSDSVITQPIRCKTSSRPFIVQKTEFDFYKKMKIPLPHLHPEIRHRNRVELRNPYILFNRTCDNTGCSTKFESTFSPKQPEKVYCEKCYLEVIE